MKIDLRNEQIVNGVAIVETGTFAPAFWSASARQPVEVIGLTVDSATYPDFEAQFYPAPFGYTATAEIGESTITLTINTFDELTVEISNPIPPTIPEWRCIDGILTDGFTIKARAYGSANIQKYIQDYANEKDEPYYFYITAGMRYDEEYDPDDVQIVTTAYEYPHYIYGTNIVTNCNLVLLAEADLADSVTLIQSLNNFKGVVIQSVYDTRSHNAPDKESKWNAAIMYLAPQINNEYLAWNNDRDEHYDVTVTFTSDTTATIGGNKRCLIYGIT